ncbi:MAG: hypothetical protein ACYSWZ_00795 [Planctomycetota bacterium]|jgi:hypothetical protein
MSAKINWAIDVQIVGGPKVSLSQTVSVEAYDNIEVTVADGAEGEDILILPGGTGQVQFLLIRSNRYGADLSYSVNAAEADSTKRIRLDSPQLLMGEGAVNILGTPPHTLFFYNNLGQDAAIQILVGRQATTP